MMFAVKNGCFCYDKKKPVINDICFSIEDGQVLSVLGSNGAGKTTLIKCMLGLLPWTSGSSEIDHRPIAKMKHRDIWTQVAYVPQAKLSFFTFSVLDMVLLGRTAHLKMLEQPNEKDVAIARECLEEIGVAHLADKMCSTISGGELQMVLIARALATKPRLLVLDEPESNLDFRNQLIVLNTIKALCKNRGIAAIVNTHYPEHALSISDKVLIIRKDGSGQCGLTRELITEKNLKSAFGVNVLIRDMKEKDIDYTCVLPISIA